MAYCVACGEELAADAAFCGSCGAPTGEPPRPRHAVYGSFGRRLVSLLIDAVVLDVPIGIVVAVAVLHGYRFGFHYHPHAHGTQPLLTSPSPQKQAVIQLVSSIPAWLYSALFMSSSWGATVGQRIMGLRVTGMTGDRISFARASGRYFASIISGYLLGIGYLMMLWSKRNQTLHDRLAGTLVIRDR